MPVKRKQTTKLSCLTLTKSIIVSSIDSMAPVCRTYRCFCQETTLHGLKHTVAKNLHWLERVLWFALTVSAFVGAVYCGLFQLSRYNSEPVVVSLQKDYRSWWTTFPAVTACFLERVQADKARDVIEMIWNVTEERDSEKFQYYYGFVELVADVSFRTNLQNFWKYQADDSVKQIDLLRLAFDVHPTFPLQVLLSKSDIEVQWVPIMTEIGMCMTFNSDYAKYQLMLPDLVMNVDQLHKCHYHSAQCFVRIDSMNNAVKYFIHSPFEIPTAISNPTGDVYPGEELVMDFKTVEIQAAPSLKTLRTEQRRCRFADEWLSGSIKAYSFGLCQMHCRTRMALMFCGCRPFFYVIGDGNVCDAHGMACIGRNVEILINLPKNLAKCSCLPQCIELNYYSHTKKVVFRDSDAEDGQMATVRINLMPPKLRLHRDVIFTLEDLFASIGGTTALFVGASVLTVIETILFIIRQLTELVFKRTVEERIVEFRL